MIKKDVINIYNLPKDVKFCKKCTISNQRLRITFNSNGISAACNLNIYKRNGNDWKKRGSELKKLLDRNRSNDGPNDYIIPFSGGKDSSHFYINREFLEKNKNKKFDYMRSKEAKFFINSINSDFENLYID